MYRHVLHFWFDEVSPEQWWASDPEFDRLIAERFGEYHRQAALCELFGWRESARGRLAEIIVLDQFSRNMFRDTPRAFAYDGMALALAQEGVALGAARALKPVERSFFYLPYMHSESALVHEKAVRLYDINGIPENYEYELRHKAIIDRFGRYPHRNKILGRESTAEELEFLTQPNSSF